MPFKTDRFREEVISMINDLNGLVFVLVALRHLITVSKAETSSRVTYTERWQHQREEQRVITCICFYNFNTYSKVVCLKIDCSFSSVCHSSVVTVHLSQGSEKPVF